MKIDMGEQTDELQIQELKKRVKYYSDQILMLSQLTQRLRIYSDTTDLYRKKNERLTKKVKQLYKRTEKQNQRIKRLEEAGDYLCAAAAFMGWHDKIETWNKAKEAK